MAGATLTKYDVLGKEEDVKAISELLKKDLFHFRRNQKSSDFHIVVGGDGVILYKDVKRVILDGKPVLHVHYKSGSDESNDKKSLGFTADITPGELHNALADIEKGECFIKEEKLLDCYINSRMAGTAINDISIKPRNIFSSLLFSATLEIQTGQQEVLPSPKCDMLLVSTKQGSTAWNVSVGGAINIDAEDCIHVNIVNSPILQSHYIYRSKDLLHLTMHSDALVGLDAQNLVRRINKGDKIDIVESKKRISFLRTSSTFETLMEKIKRQSKFNLDSITK